MLERTGKIRFRLKPLIEGEQPFGEFVLHAKTSRYWTRGSSQNAGFSGKRGKIAIRFYAASWGDRAGPLSLDCGKCVTLSSRMRHRATYRMIPDKAPRGRLGKPDEVAKFDSQVLFDHGAVSMNAFDRVRRAIEVVDLLG